MDPSRLVQRQHMTCNQTWTSAMKQANWGCSSFTSVVSGECSHSTITNSMELGSSWEANNCLTTQEIPKLYGSWWFITVFTRTHHWLLSWARQTQSTPCHHISLTSILTLSFDLHLTHNHKKRLTLLHP
jgi:hypothetical protein